VGFGKTLVCGRGNRDATGILVHSGTFNNYERSARHLTCTKLNIRLPSMFIYKDQVAKIEGNEAAKKICVELAVQKFKGIGKEVEHVLVGTLGCK
jgi:hypothetical protein